MSGERRREVKSSRIVEPPKRTLLLYILGNDRKTTQATRGKTGAGSLRLFPRESCASFLRASAISAFAHGKRTEQRPRRFLVRAGATARISRARLTRIRRETRVGCAARAGTERSSPSDARDFESGGSEIANVAHLRSARRLFSSRGATRFARVVTRAERGRDRRLLIGGLRSPDDVFALVNARPRMGVKVSATFRERNLES